MGHGWSGAHVRLVPIDEGRHFENALAWINDPKVTAWILGGDFPMTRLAEREWFDRRSTADTSDLIFAVETLDGLHIGFSGVHNIDYRHGVATTGTILGAAEEWGKGYGTEAAQLRAAYAFEVLGLRLLTSAYLDGNDRSRRMQEKVGYLEAGRIPGRYWKRGAFRDEILTYLTRERWESLQGDAARLRP